jgi:hypothetical protein
MRGIGAFSTLPKRSKMLWLIAAGAAVLLLLCYGAVWMLGFAGTSFSGNAEAKEFGTWLWTSPKALSEGEAAELLDAAAKKGVNAIYVTIDDYLDVADMAEGQDKGNARRAYDAAVAAFISAAAERDIAVDAVAGAPDWTASDNRWRSEAILNYAADFNASHSDEEDFRGVQFDVEPHLLPDYEGSKESVLEGFIAWIADMTALAGRRDVRISFVIPHFFDERQAWTPSIEYGGKRQHAFDHMLDLMQDTGGDIIVMAYRDFAEGDDSAIRISEEEVRLASERKGIRVIVALETGEIDPDYATFYGQPEEDLLAVLDAIRRKFSDESAFGGIAVHYLDTFLELR